MRVAQALIITLLVFFSHFATATVDVESAGSRERAENGPYDLTAEEKSWLEIHSEIRVGGPKSFPPFHFYDADGHPRGIGPDYLLTLMGHIGIRIHYEEELPWPEVLRKAENHEIDLIACTAETPDRERFLLFSAPYLSNPMVIFSRKDAPFIGGLSDLYGLTIAITEKISTQEWLARDHIQMRPLFVGTPLEGLIAVSTGKADACIENLAAATYLIEKNGLANLKVAAPTSWGNYELFFGVRKDWPELVSIINKTLLSLPPETQTAIRNRWISVRYEHGIRPIDIIKWVAFVMIPAGVVILLFLFHNRRLERQIADRKLAERERDLLVAELKDALANVKRLSGLLPICSNCKKIRDDKGYWNQLESYIQEHSDAKFSHSICRECARKLYPELNIDADS
jgi:two-component system sensor histidine kinase EvgS